MEVKEDFHLIKFFVGHSRKRRCAVKVTCSRGELLKGLRVVERVTRRADLPILANVLMDAREESLTLVGTDLEIVIRQLVGAGVETEGAVTVPAKPLTQIIKSCASEYVDLEAGDEDLKIRAPSFEADIKGIAAWEFPTMPEFPSRPKARLNPQILGRMIRQTHFAASTGEQRPILTGVLLDFTEGKLTMVAADGFRFSISSTELPDEVKKPINIIVPARALSELARISSKAEETVLLFLNPHSTQALFSSPNTELITWLIEGKFPDHRSFVSEIRPTKKGPYTRAIVAAADFLGAVKATCALIPGTGAVTIKASTGFLEVMATSPELGSITTRLEAEIEGDEREISFQAKYLIQPLSVIEAEKVEFIATAPTKAALIKPLGERFEHFIMPIRLSP